MKWYAFTPGGSIIIETESKTKSQAIKKLLSDAKHMSYQNWAEFKNRGYTIEKYAL